jgi:hypothetical protein
MRRFSAVAAVVIALWSIGHVLPDFARTIVPIGGYSGYSGDDDGLVRVVDPGSPAERAGIRVGDRIVITAMPFDQRRSGIVGNGYGLNGSTVVIPIERDGKLLRVTLKYGPEQPFVAPVAALRVAVGVITIVTALVLVLLRPGIATWGFLFFAAGANIPSAVVDTVVPFPWRFIDDVINDVLAAASPAGLLLFVLTFAESMGRMRQKFQWAVPVLAAVLFALMFRGDAGAIYFGWPGEAAQRLYRIIEPLVDVGIVGAFVYAFVKARGDEKERLKWVVVGFSIAILANALAEWLFPDVIPYWVYASMQLFGVCIPIATAYAVIRHRVLDLQFALSKAVVYGILTTAVVGIFAVIDNGIGRIVSSSRLTAAAEVVATIAITLTLNRAHKIVDEFVDRVLFRQRHLAEERVARVARTLPHIDSLEMIGRLMVEEPVAAFHLRSGALFVKNPAGDFARLRTAGWPEVLDVTLTREDLIVLELDAEHDVVPIHDQTWARFARDVASVRAVVAMPIALRRELVAIAIYGAHANGVDLDPDEVRALASLMVPAAAALAHLEMLELKKTLDEVQTVRKENELLRHELNGLLASFERKVVT